MTQCAHTHTHAHTHAHTHSCIHTHMQLTKHLRDEIDYKSMEAVKCTVDRDTSFV